MSDSPEHTVPDTVSSVTNVGRVKWFNNRQGYGFVTCSQGDRDGEDIFVHHTALKVSEEQYKYLVQGEYVEFTITETDDETHKWQATHVTGIHSGKLMCETRNDSRNESRGEDGGEGDGNTDRRGRGRPSNPRVRGGGPRDGDTEWRLVEVRRSGKGKGGRGGGRPRQSRPEDEHA